MMVGLILIVAAPLIGMWLFVTLSRLLPDKTETAGPHVIVRVQKQSDLGIHSYYRCKYCEKECEHKLLFQDEDCETFESAQSRPFIGLGVICLLSPSAHLVGCDADYLL